MTRATSMTRAASASWPISRAGNRRRSSPAGLEILVNLDHRGAVGADPLVGDGSRLPDPDPRSPVARLGRQAGAGSSFPRPATTRWPCASCRPTRRRGTRPSASSSTSSASRARPWSDGATCRSTPRPGQGGGGADAGHPPGHRRARFRARPTRTPSSARSWRSASRPRILSRPRAQVRHAEPDGVLHAVVLVAHGGLQGPAARASGRAPSIST